MFDKVSQAAEKLAINVSRRAFLGRLGQGALATAGVVGAILAFGGKAQAGYSGWCEVKYNGRLWYYTGTCVSPDCHKGRSFHCGGGSLRPGAPLCSTYVGPQLCGFK